MEAAILSDLHSDHWKGTGNILDLLHFNPEKTDAIFVAGDTGEWIGGMGEDNPMVVRVFEPLNRLGIPIYSVSGNHEYYYTDLLQVDREMEEVSHLFQNWHHLQGGQSRLLGDEYAVIGATLWTPLAGIANPIRSKRGMQGMNDRKYIKIGGKKFDYKQVITLHDAHLKGIQEALERHKDRKCIIMTHHAPSYKRIPKRYMFDACNIAYASEVANTVQAHAWISGHVHESFYTEINNTLHISNPLGYPGEGLPVFEGTYTL